MRAFQNKTPRLYFFVVCQNLPLSADGLVKHTQKLSLSQVLCCLAEVEDRCCQRRDPNTETRVTMYLRERNVKVPLGPQWSKRQVLDDECGAHAESVVLKSTDRNFRRGLRASWCPRLSVYGVRFSVIRHCFHCVLGNCVFVPSSVKFLRLLKC